ncbi:hypothetical protein, partial [Nocardioides sp. AN3]
QCRPSVPGRPASSHHRHPLRRLYTPQLHPVLPLEPAGGDHERLKFVDRCFGPVDVRSVGSDCLTEAVAFAPVVEESKAKA